MRRPPERAPGREEHCSPWPAAEGRPRGWSTHRMLRRRDATRSHRCRRTARCQKSSAQRRCSGAPARSARHSIEGNARRRRAWRRTRRTKASRRGGSGATAENLLHEREPRAGRPSTAGQPTASQGPGRFSGRYPARSSRPSACSTRSIRGRQRARPPRLRRYRRCLCERRCRRCLPVRARPRTRWR